MCIGTEPLVRPSAATLSQLHTLPVGARVRLRHSPTAPGMVVIWLGTKPIAQKNPFLTRPHKPQHFYYAYHEGGIILTGHLTDFGLMSYDGSKPQWNRSNWIEIVDRTSAFE